MKNIVFLADAFYKPRRKPGRQALENSSSKKASVLRWLACAVVISNLAALRTFSARRMNISRRIRLILLQLKVSIFRTQMATSRCTLEALYNKRSRIFVTWAAGAISMWTQPDKFILKSTCSSRECSSAEKTWMWIVCLWSKTLPFKRHAFKGSHPTSMWR